MESTTDILRERAKTPGGLGPAYSIALAGHAVLVAAMLVWPSGFLSSPGAEELPNVVTISLGGPAGPSSGGETALAARPVQVPLPLEEADEIQWEQPPAPAPPEMIVPDVDARRRPEAEIPVEAAPEEARGRTPTRGPELRKGNALAETGAQGAGLGLSAGGLGADGSLELADFCCAEYLSILLGNIQRRWDSHQRITGEVRMKFTVQRDGRITDVVLVRGSGYLGLDQSAERALRSVSLPPLPARYTEDDLTIHLNFQYQP
jgi:protein TonB